MIIITITRSSFVFLIIFTLGIAPTIILVRVQMRLSFDDEESFKEAIESLCFNNPSSDPNTQQQMGSNNTSMALENTERNEDNNTPSDPITTLRRVGSSSSLSIRETRRSTRDIDNPPSNPELEFTSANGM